MALQGMPCLQWRLLKMADLTAEGRRWAEQSSGGTIIMMSAVVGGGGGSSDGRH